MQAKRKSRILALICAVSLMVISAKITYAQEIETPLIPEVIDTLNGKIENAKSDIDLLKRLKVSGYIQAQWQIADTAGIAAPFSGGNFPGYSDNRFAIRRGRIKFTYDNEFSSFVLQLDATEKGVGLKDAYVSVREPWKQFATLTTGVFNRPFGYEIVYSSNSRETPERSRIFQTLFPQERDLGSMITLQPVKGSRFDWIKLDAGLFAGNGINPEFDKHKDFIGRLGISKANRSETIKYGLGVSYYNGGVFQGTNVVYKMGTVVSSVETDTVTHAIQTYETKGFVADSSKSNKYDFAKRQYLGFDGQISLQSILGYTTLRGEYIMGTQPGSSDKQLGTDGKEMSVTGNMSIASGTAPTVDTYIRKFRGGYVYLIQNIGQTKLQLVVKYDWLDPNTKVSGSEIVKTFSPAKAPTFLTKADIAYNTLGLGINYRFNSQVKFTVYYEMVKNESTSIKGTNALNDYSRDLKDNVLTLRVQYRF